MKRRYQVITSLAAATLFLALFLHRVDLGEMVRVLGSVHIGWILAGIAANLASVELRAVRWVLMLRPVHACSIRRAAGATYLGYALSTILPGRVGEVVRPLHLATAEHFSRVSSLTSVLVERIMDLWIMLLLFFIGIWTIDASASSGPIPLMRRSAAAGMGVLAAAYGMCLLLLLQPRLYRAIRAKIHNRRIGDFFDNLMPGLSFLRPDPRLALIVILGIMIWLLISVNAYCALRAFGIDSVPLPGAFIVVALMGAGFIIPTPGGVGSVHKAIQLGLVTFYAIPLDVATAYAIALHAASMLPITAIGLVYMTTARIRWRSLVAMRPDGRSGEPDGPDDPGPHNPGGALPEQSGERNTPPH